MKARLVSGSCAQRGWRAGLAGRAVVRADGAGAGAALEEELTDHVGYEPHDPAGHHSGNPRNGTRAKTVLTEVGPVSVEVPRDRAGTFEPMIVPKGNAAWMGWTGSCCPAWTRTKGVVTIAAAVALLRVR